MIQINKIEHTPIVSIIIINYNANKILENCVKSILRFTTDLDFEIIIVDNHSSEFDSEFFTSLSKRVKIIINKSNIGFGKANNKGLKEAKGKYVLFLNNDTIFLENSILKILNYISDTDKKQIIGCKLLNKDGSLQISIGKFENLRYLFFVNYFIYLLFPRSKFFNKYYLNYLNLSEPTEVDFVKGAFIFCLNKYAKELNGFDENFYFYGEEVDFCYRFKKLGGKVIYYPNTKIIHIGGATTDLNNWFKYKNQAASKIQFYQKYFKGIKFLIALIFHYSGLLLRTAVYLLIGLIRFDSKKFIKSYYFFKQIFIYPKNKFK